MSDSFALPPRARIDRVRNRWLAPSPKERVVDPPEALARPRIRVVRRGHADEVDELEVGPVCEDDEGVGGCAAGVCAARDDPAGGA